jgi:pullulanase/glycogen debranching enzyme
VRDFSIADASVPAEHAAPTWRSPTLASKGMTHLKGLAQAGANYVHLLPVFDIATIPERRSEQAQPPCDLAAMAPDSSQQQECIGQIRDADGFNWGYDPFHYNVPEGSYATNPDGPRRSRELRQAVAGLNGAGLRVVVDVVYNHTPAAGTDRYSVLDQIVPGYYQRLLDDGTVANSTCCANTAPRTLMMGKLVVDSVVLWAKQYKVDGFRFDLMGHHPKANILAVRAASTSLTVARDGVDGKRILLYGEGWDFGEVAGDQRFEQATQRTWPAPASPRSPTGCATRSAAAARSTSNPRIQGFGSGLYTDPNGDPVNGSRRPAQAGCCTTRTWCSWGCAGTCAQYRSPRPTGARSPANRSTTTARRPGTPSRPARR